MTQNSLPGSDTEQPFVARRSHRKSRLGCTNCKQRRIKCDEARPACANCLRRRKQCDFLQNSPGDVGRAICDKPVGVDGVPLNANSRRIYDPVVDWTTSQASSPQALFTPESSIDQEDSQDFSHVSSAPLNATDLELLHHFITSTCHEFAHDDKDSSYFWRTKVPQIGFAHDHTLHMLLALAALHLGRCSPQRLQHCQKQADMHYSRALPTVIKLVQNLDADNCESLLITSILICFFHFAKGPKPGQFIAFSDAGECEWFSLLRGVRSINTTMSQMNLPSDSDKPGTTGHETATRKLAQDLDFKPHLSRLRSRIVDLLAADPHALQTHLTALDELEEVFSARYKDSQPQDKHSQVFAWLYRVGEAYVASLQRRRPASLAVFAHWAVLLRDIECGWLFDGWQRHVMSGVLAWMTGECLDLIAWPLREAGLEPG